MRDLRALADEELLGLTPREPEAFDEFYQRHERLVLAFLRRRTASADVAVDLTAETFVAALGSVRRFSPGGPPAVAWLLGIARHKLLRSVARGRVEASARRRLGAPRIDIVDDELERIDRLGAVPVEQLLARLTPAQADAIRARILEEEPYEVVAKRLRCSEHVARKRVSRGLAVLRQTLEESS